MIKAAVNILKKCMVTTKQFERENAPSLPLVIDRLYTMDCALNEFIGDDPYKTSFDTSIESQPQGYI